MTLLPKIILAFSLAAGVANARQFVLTFEAGDARTQTYSAWCGYTTNASDMWQWGTCDASATNIVIADTVPNGTYLALRGDATNYPASDMSECVIFDTNQFAVPITNAPVIAPLTPPHHPVIRPWPN